MPRARTSAAALLALTALTAALAAGPTASASAASSTDWWYAKYDVAGAQSQGLTGKGIKIAVIDGPFNASLEVFQGADITVPEPSVCGDPASTTTATIDSVHSADVTSLLVGNGTGPGAVKGIAPEAKVTVYANSTQGAESGCTKTVDGVPYTDYGLIVRKAVADGNRIISISQATNAHLRGDELAIADAIARGVVIVAGDPNSLTDPGNFPANANGVVSVNAFKESGDLQTDGGVPVAFDSTTVVAAGVGFSSQGTANSASWGDDGRRMQGSSLATPLVSGMLALVAQKYPQATGNQLVQSLIHNTGGDDHPLTRYEGGYGYGPASLTHMLKVDPTQYPDENPLMNEPGHLGVPTVADVAAAKKALASASASPLSGPSAGSAAPSASQRGGFSPVATALIAAGVLGGLVVIAGVVVLIVLLTRRRPSTRG
ncbi:hypothetical protein GCM10027515_08430 [Schumannella luteola]|uniref:Peptidase S8/S53 domain-containing protein n=1 Tax=Schumannella luteola TaxID=472059 RepID=A0A852YG58_9MICO|nr:S8 family serine peptidase [Schumannella luteola]NYG98028.1 hypothetical protein [Schumannella luteola]TPX01759.1 S8 family peptidase [Schumannella luteola]